MQKHQVLYLEMSDEMMFFPHFQSIGMSTMYIALTVCEWCAFCYPEHVVFSLVQCKIVFNYHNT